LKFRSPASLPILVKIGRVLRPLNGKHRRDKNNRRNLLHSNELDKRRSPAATSVEIVINSYDAMVKLKLTISSTVLYVDQIISDFLTMN
jgi:hypothetical protein